jgi:hypothetical protein
MTAVLMSYQTDNILHKPKSSMIVSAASVISIFITRTISDNVEVLVQENDSVIEMCNVILPLIMII